MRFRRSLIASLLILAIGRSTDMRADLYWDSNGASAGGSNSDAAPGAWGVDNFWGADPSGLAVTGPWVADETAVFSADTNVIGTYDVTVSATQSASEIHFEEGTVTLNGGTINLANAATVNVAAGLTSTINSVLTGSAGLTQSGSGTLVLGGVNTYSGNTMLASSPVAFNTLRLGASGVIPDTSVVQILGQNSSFELNGQTETVKSISGGGTNSRIDVGTGTLILNDLTGEVSTFSSQVIASSTGKIIKNGGGQINLNASSGSWDGEFVLNDGILGFGANNSLGAAASGTARLTLNGGTVTASGNLLTGRSIQTQNVDITNSFSALMHGANFQFIGTGTGTPAGDEGTAVITLKVANPTITVSNTTGAGTFIFTGPVGDEGQNRGFTKDGPGVLTLNSSTNTYGGDTTILAGQVRIDGNATLGDGTGTVHLSGGNLATTMGRDAVANPIPNPINMSADAVISTTRAQVEPAVNANFTSGSIVGTAGTLTFRNDAAAGGTQTTNQFEPQFSGSGLNFSRPIVIAAGLNSPLRTTRFNSTNASGTQTFSGDISGPGLFRRMVDGGTTILTGANTYSGGTTVEGGTLTVSGALATLGAGDVTVTGGTLSISSGVTNAIADTAALSISGTGIVNLGAGISDLIAGLSLGGVAQTNAGTYGSLASSATFKNAFFAGLGVVNLASTAVDDADFDADGDVDGADFLTWQRGLGLSGGAATLAAGNANGDTVIDGADLTVWRNQFGLPAVPTVGAVPEPAAVWMALAAMAGLLGSRSRACRRPCN